MLSDILADALRAYYIALFNAVMSDTGVDQIVAPPDAVATLLATLNDAVLADEGWCDLVDDAMHAAGVVPTFRGGYALADKPWS